MVLIATILDPLLEKLLSLFNLKKFAWNIIIHAKKI